MNQIERIRLMEEKADKVRSALGELESAARKYRELQSDVKDLERYYETIWREDFEDEEKGKLPPDLKRGILSEDMLYNLLTDFDEIKKYFL